MKDLPAVEERQAQRAETAEEVTEKAESSTPKMIIVGSNNLEESLESPAHATTPCLLKKMTYSQFDEKLEDSQTDQVALVDKRDNKGIIPLFFERATGNVFNPCFDSEVLETEFKKLSNSVDKRLSRIGFLYIALVSLVLAIYFGVNNLTKARVHLAISCAVACLIALLLFVIVRFLQQYRKPSLAKAFLSVFVTLLYGGVEVISFIVIPEDEFSHSARFGLATCMITVIYTMMPALPLYVNMMLAILYSIAHELVSSFNRNNAPALNEVISVVLLHTCVHLIGYSAVFMAQVRKRSTFWRIGQSIIAQNDLEIDQRIKNRMIRSVMPKKVAEFLIQNGLKHRQVDESDQNNPFFKSFRPFTMNKMENVSILFADIVGFTNMSANKKADDLVYLLNMLFGKFDELTKINNCEKISTLGDCYYCVAGCPEESIYHAISCIEMGLDIVEAIKEFRKKTGEDVDMRVGIHTGNVLCGIVGNRRRRFDVWSNDVKLANKMESRGQPGRVHFTCKTLEGLDGQYLVEEGAGIELSEGRKLKSYFVTSRTNGLDAYKPWLNPENSFRPHTDSLVQSEYELLQFARSKERKTEGTVPEGDQVNHELVQLDVNDENNKTDIVDDKVVKNMLPYSLLENTFSLKYGLSVTGKRNRTTQTTSIDHQLVNLVREKNIRTENFFKPPLSWFCLKFDDSRPAEERNETNLEGGQVPTKRNSSDSKNETEKKYREEGFKRFKLNPKVATFASPNVNFFLDVITNSFNLIGVVLATVLLFSARLPSSLVATICVCMVIIFIVLTYQASKFIPRKIVEGEKNGQDVNLAGNVTNPERVEVEIIGKKPKEEVVEEEPPSKKQCISAWVLCHLLGGLIMCLPIAVVFSTYRHCVNETWAHTNVEYFTMLMFVGLLHFCSFTQLSSLMKSGIAYAWAIAFVLILLLFPESNCIQRKQLPQPEMIDDIVVVVFLQVVLITVLNRVHELGVRANFHGDKEAAEQKNKALEQKHVAEWLVNDMFPRHVFRQLKYTKNVSNNYDMVGVLFATLDNFSEFYEESFEGGLECIRVLHELVADFDNELMKKTDIEKIKTVYGTTFMAASGLNQLNKLENTDLPSQYMHLKSLIEFALSMQRLLDEFNQNMLGFTFKLKCGFNAGPVTAGVMGTLKPQYDIWGDTVNLASRMDSTGVVDRIQVSEDCMKKLEYFYTFEKRGTIPVKGKGYVSTYLLVKTKEKSVVDSELNTA